MTANNETITPIPGIESLTYDDISILLNAQRLWMELIEWIRNFFHSALAGLPDQSAVANQLFVKLPSDIYNEFRKYYSEAEALQFLDIVHRMIETNWRLASAYNSKDRTAIELSRAQLYQIADELAVFLAGTNPYLDETQLKTMLHEYFNLRIKQIVALLNGDYESEIMIYHQIVDITVRLANYLSMGTIAQRHAVQSSASYYCRYFV